MLSTSDFLYAGFTLEPGVTASMRILAINHGQFAFIENKRYGEEPGAHRGVVNRNGVFVYQTDALLIFIQRKASVRHAGRAAPMATIIGACRECSALAVWRAHRSPRLKIIHGETVQSMSMFKKSSLTILVCATALGAGVLPSAQAGQLSSPPRIIYAQPVDPSLPQTAPVHQVTAQRNLGGGFIELLFGDGAPQGQPDQYSQPVYIPQTPSASFPQEPMQQGQPLDVAHPAFDPKFEKQMVAYDGKEKAGTIVIDTPQKFLYLVQDGGTALRYGIGVGRPGFAWSGIKTISAKKEWPDWTPPSEMLARRPDLPRHMVGGPENPLGARAMYLGSSLYRIHGSNEPWTIGTNVSSGCIRMRNQDVIDLYGRVNVGARVVVI